MKFFVLSTDGKIAEFAYGADARLFAMTKSMVARYRDQYFEVYSTEGRHYGTFVNGTVKRD